MDAIGDLPLEESSDGRGEILLSWSLGNVGRRGSLGVDNIIAQGSIVGRHFSVVNLWVKFQVFFFSFFSGENAGFDIWSM